MVLGGERRCLVVPVMEARPSISEKTTENPLVPIGSETRPAAPMRGWYLHAEPTAGPLGSVSGLVHDGISA